MATATTRKGSAGRWGPLWNSRSADWAAIEDQQVPTYKAALEQIGLSSGDRVLEVGCGSGVFLRLAADRGFHATGIDASEELVQLARGRVPEAVVRVADLQFLPFEDGSFDAVFGFNAYFFAVDLVAALRESGRVAKPGAPVVAQVWGAPERCDLTAMKRAVTEALAAAFPEGARRRGRPSRSCRRRACSSRWRSRRACGPRPRFPPPGPTSSRTTTTWLGRCSPPGRCARRRLSSPRMGCGT